MVAIRGASGSGHAGRTEGAAGCAPQRPPDRRRTKAELARAARAWVESAGARTPGFCGAFLHGSILDHADDAELAPWSDVDVIVVLDNARPSGEPAKPGKLLFHDVLLDVAYVPWEHVRVPERVLADYRLAPSLARLHILADPGGRLAEVHRVVSREYPKPEWIERRLLDARANALDKLRSVPAFDRLHERVMAWLFGAGILCHCILVGGLRNPTVRKRYLAARELLRACGREDVYQTLLDLLGCSRMGRERALLHLERMASAFDAATRCTGGITGHVAASSAGHRSGGASLPFASDVTDVARPISVDGSRELIDRGDHREAIFWIAVTYCRCLKILEACVVAEAGGSGCDGRTDAGDTRRLEVHFEGFAQLIADLGIKSPQDVQRRAAEVEASLPAVMEAARSIAPAS